MNNFELAGESLAHSWSLRNAGQYKLSRIKPPQVSVWWCNR